MPIEVIDQIVPLGNDGAFKVITVADLGGLLVKSISMLRGSGLPRLQRC